APEACALDPEALEQAQSDFRQLLKLAAKAQLSMAGWPCASPNDGSDQPQHQDGDRAGADRPGGLNVVKVEGGRLSWERAKQQRDQTA
ncbi:hypothetical protein PO002_44450, partial [Cupriavidus necator]|uniref:hypothetical protein n=1 Tax=Cupriavidus necator TaxID=106590 RepID=UPI0039C1B020